MIILRVILIEIIIISISHFQEEEIIIKVFSIFLALVISIIIKIFDSNSQGDNSKEFLGVVIRIIAIIEF